MSTVPSSRFSVALMLLSATAVFAADDEKDNTDFLLNVFSDIGPILALFGEQFARQFLSETFTWEDHIIFACVPLGIMTAISGAIRVQGHNFFKAVIGRARENHAAAEIEYMSSTSTEVCELYNGEGIVRTMGKPYIGQIIVCPEGPPNGDQQRNAVDSFSIHTLETAKKQGIVDYQEYRVESRPRFFKWFERSPKPPTNSTNSTIPGPGDLEARGELSRSPGTQERTQSTSRNGRSHPRRQQSSRSRTLDGQKSEKKNPWLTLRSPNLQLNIPCESISERKHRFHLVLAAVCALILQIALLIIAVSTVYFISGFEPEPWGLPCYLSGSILLFLGMLACSVAIEKRTRELTWYRPNRATGLQHQREEFHLLWVQRSQRVSEQDFGSYIIDGGANRRHITTSSRHEDLEGLDGSPPSALGSTNEQAGSTDTPSGQQKGNGEDPKFSHVLMLPLVAVLFGGTGFTVQFIGLRGLPWPCAVSQLGAMIIMAIIRALIRRRLAKHLDSRPVLQNHELDYLAIQLVEKDGRLFDDHPDRNSSPGRRWNIRAMVRSMWDRMTGRENDRKYQPSTEVLVWKVDTASDVTFEPREESSDESTDSEVELVFKPCHNTTATESNSLLAPTDSRASETAHNNDDGSENDHTDQGQRTVLVRKRLGDLCKWPNSTSKSALALALSIERFMKEFFPDGFLTNKAQNKLIWKIPFSRSRNSAQNAGHSSSDQTNVSWIRLDVTGDSNTKTWTVDNGQIEAILSLWMAHWTAHRAHHLETNGKEDGSEGQKPDWRRAGDGSHVEYCRRVGESRNGVLKRDISWWVNNAVEGLQVEDHDERDGTHGDAGSGSKEKPFIFGFNSVKPSTSFNTSGSSGASTSSTVSITSSAPGSSVLSRGPEVPDGSEVSGSTGPSKFLVQHSTADLVTVMAQHLFTCFIWNIGSLLPKNLLNRGDVNINEFVKVESSRLIDVPSSIRAQSGRRLSHRQLTKFVNYAEKQGLGTPDDILLCIIPTLSFFDCLPNNIVLAYDQLVPKPFGSFELEDQRDKCSDYSNILDCIQEENGIEQDEYLSLAAVVNTMEFVYLIALHVARAKACGMYKKATTHPDVAALLEKLFKNFRNFLRILSPFYGLQRRLQVLKELFSNFEICTEIDEVWSMDWNEQKRDRAFMHKIGFTSWHLRVVDVEPDHHRLKLRTLLTVVPNGTGRDIFGWTPLHYAASRPELKFKPETEPSQTEPASLQLKTALNENIKTNRWVDKFRRSPIHIAAAAGNINMLDVLLPYLNDEAKLAMFKGGVDGMNPLHLSAQGNHKNCKDGTQQDPAEGDCNKCIVTLLRYRSSIHNDADAWKQSPVHTALTKECYKCTLILLESDSVTFSPEASDEFRKSLVSYLDPKDDEHRRIGRELLLKHYKKFELRKRGGDNILHHAIKLLTTGFDLRRLLRSVKDWISASESDFTADVTNSRRRTPLHLAVSADKHSLATHLVLCGASSCAQDKDGISPMILSCQRGDPISARILLQDAEYRGDEMDSKGQTALHHATSSRWVDDDDCLDIVQKLADVMKSIDVADKEGKTPLQSAIEANRKFICITLLGRKASIKLVNISKLSALNDIVQSDDKAERKSRAEWELQIRKETESRANDQDKDGNTALHRAIHEGDESTVNWLMSNNADFYVKNKAGRTAFIEACHQNKCHRFIEHVVDALNPGSPESTANEIPQQEAGMETQQLDSNKANMWSLDNKKFNINDGDSIYDQSALAWACENGHEHVVEILLKANTINVQRKASQYHDYTSLHLALDEKKASIVKLLLNHSEGHEILNEEDEHGQTPVQFAIKNPDKPCLYELIMHPNAGPGSFSCQELMEVLKVCSGVNIKVDDKNGAMWNEKAAEGFLDEDKWTLADIAGKYGHPILESHLRKTVYSTETTRPRRPSSFLCQEDGLTLTNHPTTNEGRTINIGLLYWVEKPQVSESFFYLRTEHPIPPDAEYFFFQVKIVHLPKNQIFMLGFCRSDVPGDMLPGWNEGSWAYHADDGGLYERGDWFDTDTSDHEHVCKVGDTMGCGVDFTTGKGYRKRNGKHLDSGDAFADPWLKMGKLYPCVGFRDDGTGDKLEVEISLPGSEGYSFERHLPQSK